MNREQAAEQMRKAIQLFAKTLSEEQALEIATVYPKYEIGKNYYEGDYFTFGENAVKDPQLYKVLQPHTSQADWLPNISPSLYVAIGLTEEGYAVWSRPTGAHDAYNTGDIVCYNDVLYISLIDGNVYSPDEYPAGWKIYNS